MLAAFKDKTILKYLFYKFPAANYNGRIGVIDTIIVSDNIPFLEVSRYDKLKLPSTFLP